MILTSKYLVAHKSLKSISLALGMLFGLAQSAYANELARFNDQGNFYGLEGMHSFTVSAEPGRVEVVKDVYRDNGSSIRFHLMPGDCSKTFSGDWDDCEQNNQRVDLSIDSPTNRAVEEFYTLSMMLDANFSLQQHRPNKSRWADINLFQFYRRGNGACFNLFVNYGFRSLALDNRCANGLSYDHGSRILYDLGKSDFNTWYDFVFHVRWSSNQDGFFKVYESGTELLNYNGPTIIPDGNLRDVSPQMFIYRYGIEFFENTTPLTWWADNVGRYLSNSEMPERFRLSTSKN